METLARIETITVAEGEQFPLDWKDEVIATVRSTATGHRHTLTILRRGV